AMILSFVPTQFLLGSETALTLPWYRLWTGPSETPYKASAVGIPINCEFLIIFVVYENQRTYHSRYELWRGSRPTLEGEIESFQHMDGPFENIVDAILTC